MPEESAKRELAASSVAENKPSDSAPETQDEADSASFEGHSSEVTPGAVRTLSDGEVCKANANHDARHREDRHHRLTTITGIGVVLSLCALAVASLTAIRQLTPAAPVQIAPTTIEPHEPVAYTDSQRADSRSRICHSYALIRTAVTRNTTLQLPNADSDPVAMLAGAANARLSLLGGGQYLLATQEAATPLELADPVRKFANLLMEIGAAAMAGIDNNNPDQSARLRDALALDPTIQQQCA